MVPSTTEMIVEMMATLTEIQIASWTLVSSPSARYQSSVKPPHWPGLRAPLKL
jgi:hypothetical protein